MDPGELVINSAVNRDRQQLELWSRDHKSRGCQSLEEGKCWWNASAVLVINTAMNIQKVTCEMFPLFINFVLCYTFRENLLYGARSRLVKSLDPRSKVWISILAPLVMYKILGQALNPQPLCPPSSDGYQVARKVILCEWLQLQKKYARFSPGRWGCERVSSNTLG